MKKIIVIVAASLCLPLLFLGQQSGEDFEKRYEFNEDTDKRTVSVKVPAKTSALAIAISGMISEGKLSIHTIDPKGNKSANMTLMTSGGKSKTKSKVKVKKKNSSNDKVVVSGSDGRVVGTTVTSPDGTIVAGTAGDIVWATSKDGGVVVSVGKNGSVSRLSSKGDSVAYEVVSKAGTVSVRSSALSGSKGSIAEVLSDPAPGIWKFVIETNGVTGHLNVDIDQD